MKLKFDKSASERSFISGLKNIDAPSGFDGDPDIAEIDFSNVNVEITLTDRINVLCSGDIILHYHKNGEFSGDHTTNHSVDGFDVSVYLHSVDDIQKPLQVSSMDTHFKSKEVEIYLENIDDESK